MSAARTAPALLSALALVALLTACGPGSSTPDPGPREPTPTAAPVESATPSAEPEESEEPAPAPAAGLTAADRAALETAITSGNPAAVEGYLSNPVRVIIMSTECCFDITPAQAVSELSYVTGAPGPWNFALPASTTDPWHSNAYYGYLFTGDDVTGRAADGTIVSFGISGGQVTTILMGWDGGFDL